MAESTARVRELGRELRRVREGRGYTGHEMAIRLGWSESKVSRLETGKRSISEVEVAIYLASCGACGKVMDQLLELARDVDDGFRVHPHGDDGPLRSLLVNEAVASRRSGFDMQCVPGLLQTEDYAFALFRECAVVPEPGIEVGVRARMARQARLFGTNPPRCSFLIHEDALRAVVGDARLMHEQMLHLLFLGNLQHCLIRVVPRSAGSAGRASSGFMLLADEDDNRLAIAETDLASVFVDQPLVIDRYRRILARLHGVALDGAQSRELLAGLASVYDLVGSPCG